MKKIVTIDFDVIMFPSIDLYNQFVPKSNWDDLLKSPYYKILTIDTNHYQKILQYIYKCTNTLKKEQIHFIEDHGKILKYIDERIDLINIDHHHDLGYGLKECPNCSNWVEFLYNNDLLNSYIWYCNKNSSDPIPENTVPYIQKEFCELNIDDLDTPDELIICLSEPWVPPMYRPLFYSIMDYCNNKYSTYFKIDYGPYEELDKNEKI